MIPLATAFDTFRRNLDPVEAPADSILARYRIREHIASAWQPTREGVIGSYRRGTNPRPTRELDYLFVLDSRHQPYVQSDPSRCLDDVMARVMMAFPQVRARKLTRGVGMIYGDFTVTLVPALARHGGGVFIPDGEQRRWLPSDPDAHERFAREVDRKANGLAVPVVRALQLWQRAHGVPVRTFHLEVLALRALGVAPQSLLDGCVTALAGVSAGVKTRCPPPGTVGDEVDQYLAAKPDVRDKIAAAASDAIDALQDAVALDREKQHDAARRRVQPLFGSVFPG